MRNAAALFAPAAALALASMGCSSFVPFTYELRAQHRLTEDEVRNLQFYSSHQITLRREVQSEDRQITPGHKLRLLSGKSVEEVVIPAKTPGVATRVSPHMISVSFVSGTSLDFTVRGAQAMIEPTGGFLRPVVASGGAPASRGALSAGAPFLGQYAEPPGPSRGPVRIAGGQSSLPLDGLGGSYYLTVEGSGQTMFAGLPWEPIGDTLQAHLLIDADKLEETEERRTVLPGVRLGN